MTNSMRRQLCIILLVGACAGLCQLMLSSAVVSAVGVATTTKGHPQIKCDKYCCNCNGDKALCTGEDRHLHYLPRLPETIREFRMMRAELPELSRPLLANLSNFQIVRLNLTSNNITSITSDAFVDFPHLKILSLTGNRIPVTEVQASLGSIGSEMTSLYLDDMKLGHLPRDFFSAAAFVGKRFSVINLQSNDFTSYNNSDFKVFQIIDKLYLSHNTIDTLRLDARANISSLDLAWNAVDRLPDFCISSGQPTSSGTNAPAIHNLLSLRLRNNNIPSIPKETLRGLCLPSLLKLDISGLKLTKLEDNFLADLPKLETLTVCESRFLSEYEPYAFRSPSLRSLTLCSNRILNRKSLKVDTAFLNCPNLTDLRITNTKMVMQDEDVRQMLLPLKSLQSLYLEDTSLGNLPEDTLWRLPQLKILTFRGNHLDPFRLGLALANVSSLDYLSLQANALSIVNQSTLPWEVRQNLKKLDLSRNPFLCSCDLLWFRTWLEDVTRNKSVRVLAWSQQYRCAAPVSMRDTYLVDFRPTAQSCAVKSTGLVLLGALVGAMLVTLTVTAALSYRYRWYLRFYIYRLRRRGKYRLMQAEAADGGEELPLFNYDVYLAHSSGDIEWVNDELLPLLEGEHHLKVFLEERDTEGGTIADNIAKYMDSSARILVVISDTYVREGWRQYEFEHILYAAIEQGKDIIVLLLGNVQAGRMTIDMRRMLTRGTFLQWGDSQEARDTFRQGLKVAINTEDVRPESVC